MGRHAGRLGVLQSVVTFLIVAVLTDGIRIITSNFESVVTGTAGIDARYYLLTIATCHGINGGLFRSIDVIHHGCRWYGIVGMLYAVLKIMLKGMLKGHWLARSSFRTLTGARAWSRRWYEIVIVFGGGQG